MLTVRATSLRQIAHADFRNVECFPVSKRRLKLEGSVD